MDKATLAALYPKAADPLLTAVAGRMDSVFKDFSITPGTDRAFYLLAQVGHESGGLTVDQEDLHYSAKRLTQVWPNRFPTPDAAAPYANNPEKLANNVYAGRMGNGDEASGDGWRFHGRGLIQLTGRGAYDAVGKIAGLPLVDQPELAMDPAHALQVACAFWSWKGLNASCDAGDFARNTFLVNGGFNGMGDRVKWLGAAYRTLAGRTYPVTTAAPATVRSVQTALVSRKYTEVGTPDGIYGNNTHGGILRFRYDRKLPPGGIDTALLSALGIA